MANRILIIGGGHAGGMAAIMLRQRNFDGAITILSGENFSPYQPIGH